MSREIQLAVDVDLCYGVDTDNPKPIIKKKLGGYCTNWFCKKDDSQLAGERGLKTTDKSLSMCPDCGYALLWHEIGRIHFNRKEFEKA